MCATVGSDQGSLTGEDRQPEVIFILGILQRSGTNYLSDLLVQHPDCTPMPTIGEDFLLANADKLVAFTEGVARQWNPKWDPDGRAKGELRQNLAAACVSFLVSKTREFRGTLPRYIVTKTPSVENLHLLPFFPHSKTVVIVRDGRAVVESGMKSFGWEFEKACRNYARGAQIIADARSQKLPFLLVRYEDLVSNLRGELPPVLSYLDLDAGSYRWEAGEKLPVRGSSSFGTKPGAVHWEPVQKTVDFNPLQRSAEWDSAKHERFNWIAGRQSAFLGYPALGARPGQFYWDCRNRLLDLRGRWGQLRRFAKRMTRLPVALRPAQKTP
jgi:hypothetical protein